MYMYSRILIYTPEECTASVLEQYQHRTMQALCYNPMYIHVLMRNEKEGREKQARSNKQQGMYIHEITTHIIQNTLLSTLEECTCAAVLLLHLMNNVIVVTMLFKMN